MSLTVTLVVPTGHQLKRRKQEELGFEVGLSCVARSCPRELRKKREEWQGNKEVKRNQRQDQRDG